MSRGRGETSARSNSWSARSLAPTVQSRSTVAGTTPADPSTGERHEDRECADLAEVVRTDRPFSRAGLAADRRAPGCLLGRWPRRALRRLPHHRDPRAGHRGGRSRVTRGGASAGTRRRSSTHASATYRERTRMVVSPASGGGDERRKSFTSAVDRRKYARMSAAPSTRPGSPDATERGATKSWTCMVDSPPTREWSVQRTAAADTVPSRPGEPRT